MANKKITDGRRQYSEDLDACIAYAAELARERFVPLSPGAI